MDNSLKDLEQQLEKLSPRGMSNDGMARCEALFDELAQTKPVSKSPVGWSLRVTSIAAAVALIVGLSAGWRLGQGGDAPVVSNIIEAPDLLSSAFEFVDERSWLQLEGSPEMILTSNGEVKEIATEIDVSEETVLHRDSGNYITLRVLTKQPVETTTNQF
ncbi:MAG: hypothetical protein ABF334_04555 [Akkermansiaceae bacterium]